MLLALIPACAELMMANYLKVNLFAYFVHVAICCSFRLAPGQLGNTGTQRETCQRDDSNG